MKTKVNLYVYLDKFIYVSIKQYSAFRTNFRRKIYFRRENFCRHVSANFCCDVSTNFCRDVSTNFSRDVSTNFCRDASTNFCRDTYRSCKT